MNNYSIKDMLSAYQLNPENDSVYTYFETDNIWKILDIQRYEPSHSAFLVWFFGQNTIGYPQIKALLHLLIEKDDGKIMKNGWNNTGDIENFVNAILTGAYEIKSVTVEPECRVGKISKIKSKDRVDLIIKCTISMFYNGDTYEKMLEIIIENKVDSKEGDDKNGYSKEKVDNTYDNFKQTERYYYAFSKEYNNREKNDADYQLFVFLTPNRAKCKSINYILISYQDLVDKVFEYYLKIDNLSPNTIELIEGYLHNLGNPYHKNNKQPIAMNEKERNLLVSFFERNKELFLVTLDAMIQKSTNEGDEESANNYNQAKNLLNKTIRDRTKYKLTYNNKEDFTQKNHLARKIVEAFIELNNYNETNIEDLKIFFKGIRKNFIIENETKNTDTVTIGSKQIWIPNKVWGKDTQQFKNLLNKAKEIKGLDIEECNNL